MTFDVVFVHYILVHACERPFHAHCQTLWHELDTMKTVQEHKVATWISFQIKSEGRN
jgi:hypothetical protein